MVPGQVVVVHVVAQPLPPVVPRPVAAVPAMAAPVAVAVFVGVPPSAGLARSLTGCPGWSGRPAHVTSPHRTEGLTTAALVVTA